MNTSAFFLLFEHLKPVFQAIQLVLILAVGVFAFTRPRTVALSLLCAACAVTAFVLVVFLTASLQVQWRITLFPVEVRSVLFVIAQFLYMVEVFLWPITLFILIRERRSSTTRVI